MYNAFILGDEKCICVKCSSELIVKNGYVKGKQRYKCKSCNYNFVEIDGRSRPHDASKRALAVILYTMS
ncbi:MAG: hypothetical protein LBB12_02125, partial [Holosporaceae bacterium]|nr:hypothetical protein [Holosporaceae bacterium]